MTATVSPPVQARLTGQDSTLGDQVPLQPSLSHNNAPGSNAPGPVDKETHK